MTTTTDSPAAPPGVAPIFSPLFAINPEPTLSHLREHDPVHRLPGPEPVYVLTRAADTEAALRDPACSAAGGQEERSRRSGAPVSMLNTDGAEHDSLRRPGAALLGPAAVRASSGALAAAAGNLVSELPARFDITSAYAEPLATLALLEILGLADHARFGDFDRHARAVSVAIDPMPSPAQAAQGALAMGEFDGYVERLVATAPNSLLAQLPSRFGITPEQARGIVSLAVVGGWSPLAEVVTTALELALPDDGPADADLEPWCDDVIRWHTPIPFVARRTISALTVPSGAIPAGAQVLIHLGSANRDGRRFPDPDRVDAQRPAASAHLAFGHGAHVCLGTALVRAVVPLAIRSLRSQRPGARVASSLFVWRPGIFPRRPMSAIVHGGVAT
ncbi:putative Cytochrome P450 monooxygenase [Nostocoides australiense Ben110]|uniref:Putative Cytochrome P450 monooxygenase n=1 Tax=Nostocoides australiense Ben110 TaxID=1193182 RepID=W6JU75_9MICO|nr:cytochrome P450 [Tetrasphaera australiensis]CCH72030.1 putative Cytochrome P450 monooxygenase [Tetrasphaera australiensis Ben110]